MLTFANWPMYLKNKKICNGSSLHIQSKTICCKFGIFCTNGEVTVHSAKQKMYETLEKQHSKIYIYKFLKMTQEDCKSMSRSVKIDTDFKTGPRRNSPASLRLN